MALIDVWASLPLEKPEGPGSAWQRAKSIASHVLASKTCVFCLFLPCLLVAVMTRRVGPKRYRYRGMWKTMEYVTGDEFGSGYYWVTFRNGTKTEGQLQRRRKNGKAKVIWPNGDRYIGRYRDGRCTGWGLFLSSNGSRYKGEFRNGKHHGQGTMTWPCGDQYHGQFENHQMHGNGTYRHASGQFYEGPHRKGKRHGIGRITFDDGETARCEYREDERVRWLDDEEMAA